MSIPNHFAIVQRVHAEHPHLVATNSSETVREFYWRAAWALHQHDPNWGMLGKSEGERHQIIEGRRVSVDAVAYKGATPVVDILGSAGDGPGTGRITWNVDEHRRESNPWVQPPPFRDAAALAPPPGGAAAGDDEVRALRDAVRALRSEFAAVVERLVALENRALQYDASVVLRTNDGHVVCADRGGGGEVHAMRTEAGPWETFLLEKP